MNLRTRLYHAWNAFSNKDPTKLYGGNSRRPDRKHLRSGNERSIVNSIYNRIAIDVSSVSIQHVRLDQNGCVEDIIKSGLNEALTLSPNIDQTSLAFMLDVVMSMFDEGCVAVVPIETTINPEISSSYDILSMRTGKIMEWFPNHVRVRLYDERDGLFKELTLAKSTIAIIENPLYSVMNEPNSILQRLIRKLNLLDAIDDQSGSGKLDLIIQLPYIIKSEARKQQAEKRRLDIENQLSGSKYGIAYTDGTEKVTQLNRPAENNLMNQIIYLTNMLFNQLGMTESIFNGTASEAELLNYFNRTIKPILVATILEFKRKFLTKTARTQNQSIEMFRDPFSLVPVSEIAKIADSFSRNAILTSNEIRGIVGKKPSKDPEADKLSNKNLNQKIENNDIPEEEKKDAEE